MSRCLLLLLVLWGFAAHAQNTLDPNHLDPNDSAAPAPDAKTDTKSDTATDPVTVQVRLVPDGELKLGDVLQLEVTAISPANAHVYGPYHPALGSFQVTEVLPATVKVEADRRTETWRFKVIILRLGVEKLPPIEVPYELADGTKGQVATPILRVRVQGRLENEQDPAPGALPEPLPVITTNWALIWILSIGGALVFAALITFFVLKALEARFRALAPPPPPRPAIDVALERLAAIDQQPASELDGAERLAATIDALRVYLDGRYHIDAPEMTTRELLGALDEVDLKTIQKSEIATLLEDTDLVKFARLMPGESDARATSPIVRRIVTETWEPPKVVIEEIMRREPASLKQRYYAAAIDVGLALVLGGLLVSALVVAGANMALAGLAIPLVGLALMLRDVGGQSPGKLMLGTRIVVRLDADGHQDPSNAAERVKRNALLLVWPITLPLEALVLNAHPLRLRLGDLWAETEVVLAGEAHATVIVKTEVA